MCHGVCMAVRDLCGVGSLLSLLCRFLELSSESQACTASALPTESSCQS